MVVKLVWSKWKFKWLGKFSLNSEIFLSRPVMWFTSFMYGLAEQTEYMLHRVANVPKVTGGYLRQETYRLLLQHASDWKTSCLRLHFMTDEVIQSFYITFFNNGWTNITEVCLKNSYWKINPQYFGVSHSVLSSSSIAMHCNPLYSILDPDMLLIL